MTVEQEVLDQKVFVQKFVKDKADPDRLNRLNGDMLSYVLVILAGYYEYLGSWLAHENKLLQDEKVIIKEKYADKYLEAKRVPKMSAKQAEQVAIYFVSEDKKQFNIRKERYDDILAWKKSLSKYIDVVRSQFSYEKSLAQNITLGQ